MISAEQARANVINHEIHIYRETEEKVNELIDAMSKSIEFHSENGIDSIEFTPYDHSRFSSSHTLQLASEMLARQFKDNGYTIVNNSWEHNSFIIQW